MSLTFGLPSSLSEPLQAQVLTGISLRASIRSPPHHGASAPDSICRTPPGCLAGGTRRSAMAHALRSNRRGGRTIFAGYGGHHSCQRLRSQRPPASVTGPCSCDTLFPPPRTEMSSRSPASVFPSGGQSPVVPGRTARRFVQQRFLWCGTQHIDHAQGLLQQAAPLTQRFH